MTITDALGTSTPTSTTVVVTRTWMSPSRNRRMTASFSSAFIRPCSSATCVLVPAKTVSRSAVHIVVASRRSSFSDFSTSG
jgi:hypothetical protein